MRKAIATISIAGTLTQKLSAIAAAHYDGIEIFDNDLIASALTPTEIAQRCSDLGLTIEIFQPLRDIEGWHPDHFPAVLHRLRHKFTTMQRLGVPLALACSNALPTAIDNPDLRAHQLHHVGNLAADYGITIAYEALAWGTHINRIGHAWNTVTDTDHPAITLAIDTFHILSRGDTPTALAGIPANRIGYMQIADAPHLDMNVLNWSRHHRCYPGQGDLNLVELVGTVIDLGYRGPLSLEIFSDIVRDANPRINALDGMRSLLILEEQLRHRRSHQTTTGHPTPTIELFDPPPPPERVNPAFIEIAISTTDNDDPTPTTSITALLKALGFHHTSTHTSRPVQWWANGNTRICLTTLPTPTPPATRPYISAIALEVDHVRDVATRATALLWPPVTHRRGRYDSALPGIDTPGGLHVFLTGPENADDDWRNGYPDPTPPPHQATLTGIDHIGTTTPPTLHPAEQSFYQSVFNLHPGPTSEFIRPTGRRISRPYRPTHGDLRIILANGNTHSTIDQIAFNCTDITTTITTARNNGIHFLPTPANYYDDLQARYNLDTTTINHLRHHNLYYDQDDNGGTLLHTYITTPGNNFIIELLQRNNGYNGYGEPNTHVRLAAEIHHP